ADGGGAGGADSMPGDGAAASERDAETDGLTDGPIAIDHAAADGEAGGASTDGGGGAGGADASIDAGVELDADGANGPDGAGGNGGVTTQPSSSDLPLDDGNPCTAESCNAGTPEHPPLAAGVPCGAGVCNGAGVCGVCTPGDVRCDVGNIPQTCSASGQWTGA